MLSVAFCIGCASPYGMTWHGDVTFTDPERLDVERANDWIAERTHQEPYEIVWDAPHPADDELADVRVIARRPNHGGGQHTRGGAIDLGLLGNPLEVLAAHEFGHTRLLEHHDGGVMDPNPSVLVWTPEDEANRP